jgi:hypothetical protein
MEEIKNGVFLCRGRIRRRQVKAVSYVAAEKFARERLVLNPRALRRNITNPEATLGKAIGCAKQDET